MQDRIPSPAKTLLGDSAILLTIISTITYCMSSPPTWLILLNIVALIPFLLALLFILVSYLISDYFHGNE